MIDNKLTLKHLFGLNFCNSSSDGKSLERIKRYIIPENKIINDKTRLFIIIFFQLAFLFTIFFSKINYFGLSIVRGSKMFSISSSVNIFFCWRTSLIVLFVLYASYAICAASS